MMMKAGNAAGLIREANGTIYVQPVLIGKVFLVATPCFIVFNSVTWPSTMYNVTGYSQCMWLVSSRSYGTKEWAYIGQKQHLSTVLIVFSVTVVSLSIRLSIYPGISSGASQNPGQRLETACKHRKSFQHCGCLEVTSVCHKEFIGAVEFCFLHYFFFLLYI